MITKIRKHEKKIFFFLSLLVALYFLICPIKLSVFQNYADFLSSIQNVLIFTSGVLIASFSITSFLPDNPFIKKLKTLNLDLLIMKQLFDLSILSVLLLIFPSIFISLEQNNSANIVHGGMSIFIGSLLYFILSLCSLVLTFRKILCLSLDSEKEKRKTN